LCRDPGPRPPPASPTRRSSDLGALLRQHLAWLGNGIADFQAEQMRLAAAAHRAQQTGGFAAGAEGGAEVHHRLGVVADALVRGQDRKSTRLNSSHVKISYAVFC